LTLGDGSILPGLAEHLVEAAGTGGDFAKSEDRYKEFITFGLPLAKAFAECWEHMLAHTSSLDTDLTRNTRSPHFTPQHWLLCHMGLY